MCAFVKCSTLIPVADTVQKFDHSSAIILIYLLIQHNVGRGRILKRNLIGRDTGKRLRVALTGTKSRDMLRGPFVHFARKEQMLTW